MLLDVSFASLRPPRAKATHIFSHACSTRGRGISAVVVSLPQLTRWSQNPSEPQSISCPASPGHQSWIGRKFSCNDDVSSSWHHGIRTPLCSSPQSSTRASDGPEQSLGTSGPLRVQASPRHHSHSLASGLRLHRPLRLQHIRLLASNTAAQAADSQKRCGRELKREAVRGVTSPQVTCWVTAGFPRFFLSSTATT